MAPLSVVAANRLAFAVLGLTNNIICSIMFSAAYDLLSKSHTTTTQTSNHVDHFHQNQTSLISSQNQTSSVPTTSKIHEQEPFCNEQSTSTVLLALALPSLVIKLIYPYLFIQVPAGYKTTVAALLSAVAFIVTGLSSSQLFIFTGLVAASVSYGLAEPHFISITQNYGATSLSGWSIGTGVAGISGSLTYALLRMILSVEVIMMIMLLVPTFMMLAYFCWITPVRDGGRSGNQHTWSPTMMHKDSSYSIRSDHELFSRPPQDCSFRNKLSHLAPIFKYFFPLLLVYFAEYFINQGLFELIYYPEVEYLNHAAQYRWFQVAYQLGVLVSRSSVELIQLRNTWTMSLLQCANAILFTAHVTKLIHLPSFYLVLLLIVYEGLLGGFMYVCTFYRIRNEIPVAWQEFSISTVTVAETLGASLGGFLALPAHNSICKLYV